MADVKEIAEQLVNLTIKEANELAKVLEEEYDIKPAAAAVARWRRGFHRLLAQP